MCPSAAGMAGSRPELYRARNQGLWKVVEAAPERSRLSAKESARKAMPSLS